MWIGSHLWRDWDASASPASSGIFWNRNGCARCWAVSTSPGSVSSVPSFSPVLLSSCNILSPGLDTRRHNKSFCSWKTTCATWIDYFHLLLPAVVTRILAKCKTRKKTVKEIRRKQKDFVLLFWLRTVSLFHSKPELYLLSEPLGSNRKQPWEKGDWLVGKLSYWSSGWKREKWPSQPGGPADYEKIRRISWKQKRT